MSEFTDKLKSLLLEMGTMPNYLFEQDEYDDKTYYSFSLKQKNEDDYSENDEYAQYDILAQSNEHFPQMVDDLIACINGKSRDCVFSLDLFNQGGLRDDTFAVNVMHAEPLGVELHALYTIACKNHPFALWSFLEQIRSDYLTKLLFKEGGNYYTANFSYNRDETFIQVMNIIEKHNLGSDEIFNMIKEHKKLSPAFNQLTENTFLYLSGKLVPECDKEDLFEVFSGKRRVLEVRFEPNKKNITSLSLETDAVQSAYRFKTKGDVSLFSKMLAEDFKPYLNILNIEKLEMPLIKNDEKILIYVEHEKDINTQALQKVITYALQLHEKGEFYRLREQDPDYLKSVALYCLLEEKLPQSLVSSKKMKI